MRSMPGCNSADPNIPPPTYDEIRYEGYGPGGVAIIVDALTDNRNRTASEVRAQCEEGGNTETPHVKKLR